MEPHKGNIIIGVVIIYIKDITDVDVMTSAVDDVTQHDIRHHNYYAI